MARKTAAESATAALTRLLNQRESARKKLADLDEEIAELRAILGGNVPMPNQGATPMPRVHQHPVAEPEPELKLPDELAPQDDMGPGRLI